MTVVVWPYVAPPIPLPPDVLPVELLPIAEDTNIAAQEKAPEPPPDVKPLEMPPLPQPTPTFAPPPPPPEEDALAIEPETPPPEVKQAVPQPRFALAMPRAKPKPEKPKEEFDINKIAGLVDKIAKEPQRKDEKAEPTKAASQRSLAGAGAQTAMTMSELDALRSQLAKCWNVDPGAPDPAKLVFRLKVFLNEDGTVAAAPRLLDPGGLGDTYFRAAVDSAMRAVKMCQPYELPPAKYATWAEIDIEFDPRKMAGY